MLSNHLILSHPLVFLSSIFPASRSFPNSQLFALGGRSIRASTSESVLPMKGWFPLELSDLISFLSKGFSRVFSSTTIQKHQFFSIQPSLWSNSHIHTWQLENSFDYIDLLICLIGLNSFDFMAAVTISSDFGAQENKICYCFHFFPFSLPWSDGIRCHDLSLTPH